MYESPGAIQREFEHLIARLRGFLSQSFDENGDLIVADPNLAVTPVGGMVMYGGSTAPTGWELCDGGQLSRVTHKSLFDVIGTNYGPGDGSTTFNKPDMRQRFPLGLAASGTGNALGATGGAIDHTHSIASGGSHAHTVASHTHTIPNDGGHSHTVDGHTHGINNDGSHDHGGATGSHSHDFDGETDVYGPDGDITPGSGANAVGAHTHTFDGTTDGATASISSDGDHDHGGQTTSASPSTDSEPDHDHTGATGSSAPATDSQGAHDHGAATGATNPPFAVVNYIIFTGVA